MLVLSVMVAPLPILACATSNIAALLRVPMAVRATVSLAVTTAAAH